MKFITAIVISVIWSTGAFGQAYPPIAETEAQFARSQALRSQATTAFRAGELASAFKTMKEALALRPGNPALLGNALYLASEVGDGDAAAAFAKAYADLGLVPSGAIYRKLSDTLTNSPAHQAKWAEIQARFTANEKAVGSAKILAEIPTSNRLIEGIAPRPDGGFYLSTVVSGTLLELESNGQLSVLFDGADHAVGSFFGIAYSNPEQALYATYGRIDQTPNIPEDAGRTGVMRIDPETGKMTGDWSLAGGTQKQQIADIAISPEGIVYLTEAQTGALYQVDGDHLKQIDLDANFMSPQGLVVGTKELLLMADYGRGLWLIDPFQAAAKLLPVPADQTLIGIDGLFHHQGSLFAIQNGVQPHRIVEIILDLSHTMIVEVRILARNLPEFDEPTLGVSTPDGIVFVASSQWPKYGEGGTLREGTKADPTKIMLLQD